MKTNKLISTLIGLILFVASPLLFAQNGKPSVISLKSCNLEIRADQISYHHGSISFSGNVQFLYGLASVKTDSVVLVKKKDGSCQLVAQPWSSQAGH